MTKPSHGVSFTVVGPEEKEEHKEALNAALKSSYHEGNLSVDQLTYYKVHFTEAMDLVRKRTSLLVGGQCYVPETEMATLLAQKFKSLLTQVWAIYFTLSTFLVIRISLMI